MEDISTPMTCFAPARAANLFNKTINKRSKIPGLLSGCIHAQNTSSTADIEDDLVLEDVAVLVDGVAVGACAHIIFLEGRE